MKEKYDKIRYQKLNRSLCLNARKGSIYNNRVELDEKLNLSPINLFNIGAYF